MVFKKKAYKRSGWFEGLLDAEEYSKNGYEFRETPSGIVHQKDNVRYLTMNMYESSRQKIDGMRDYEEYKHSVLEKLK